MVYCGDVKQRAHYDLSIQCKEFMFLEGRAVQLLPVDETTTFSLHRIIRIVFEDSVKNKIKFFGFEVYIERVEKGLLFLIRSLA